MLQKVPKPIPGIKKVFSKHKYTFLTPKSLAFDLGVPFETAFGIWGLFWSIFISFWSQNGPDSPKSPIW